MSGESCPFRNPKLEDLMSFPADYPIKIMGKALPGFADRVVGRLGELAPGFDPATTEMKASSGGKYVSLTCVFKAQSAEHVYAMYAELKACEGVQVVL